MVRDNTNYLKLTWKRFFELPQMVQKVYYVIDGVKYEVSGKSTKKFVVLKKCR